MMKNTTNPAAALDLSRTTGRTVLLATADGNQVAVRWGVDHTTVCAVGGRYLGRVYGGFVKLGGEVVGPGYHAAAWSRRTADCATEAEGLAAIATLFDADLRCEIAA
jgi:hypothetical protein